MNFLVPYCVLILISSCLAALLTPLIRSLALHIGAVDHPRGRKIHKTPTPRLGGVSVVLAGTLTVVAVLGLDQVLGHVIGLNPEVWFSVLPGGGIILLVGIWDDLRSVRAGVKFCCIATGAGITLWLGIRLENVSLFGSSSINLGALSLPLTSLWIFGITNAFNLVDGLGVRNHLFLRKYQLITPAWGVVLSPPLPTHWVAGRPVLKSTNAVWHSRPTLSHGSESGCSQPAPGQ
jgi:UDP-GlcNAc:undecaprenyl-phosphate/decaprenyl-phosphate GlcNAc-1-phosphate transferase